MRDGVNKVVLIAGPTASGKSALALDLARRHGGVVINADSMQVYRDLRIITARPTVAEEQAAPHRLYGHVDATENYSVGRWCRDAMAELDTARLAGRMAIVIGGTGLYFSALTRGLTDIPPVPGDVRAAMRERLAREGVAALHAELMVRDPAAAARIMPRDQSRITRALEVLTATGRTLTDWHTEGMPARLDAAHTPRVFLRCEREALVQRIEARFDAMLAAGARDEVAALAARGLDPMLPAMKAHGVPWLIRHLRGEISLDEATEGGKRDTRRYAKRQNTWFRNQLPDWPHVAPEDAMAALERQLNG
ncbi:MAG: tRNA (adenosine(37)-N6)-dimethylallyltransferase MiaA [Rhizobiales bacterium]|nr:tRNA (adenosine(37)-N6)-dimethylallyltransferase MiaA [Hyphomicrobiales bacterium]OJY42861.1 MAG: tRNA (adenosine(37)-N6)-dimethylallyltransferase MiaA [Rhizobiales bacterium 64-17]